MRPQPLTDSGFTLMGPMVHTELNFLTSEHSYPEQGRVWNKAGGPLTNSSDMLALTLLHSEMTMTVPTFNI